MELGVIDNTTKNAAKQRKNRTRTEKRMCSLLSRLAREAKVVRVSGIVSGFRGCGLRRSPGSAELRRAAFPPRKIQDSGTRGISPALQSRGGDGFAPSSRHGVCGHCGGALRVPAWPGRSSAPGERTRGALEMARAAQKNSIFHLTESLCEILFGLCSAHLQVGNLEMRRCPPEGGRYMN